MSQEKCSVFSGTPDPIQTGSLHMLFFELDLVNEITCPQSNTQAEECRNLFSVSFSTRQMQPWLVRERTL